MTIVGVTKICTICGVEKPTPEFMINKRKCKACYKSINRDYYLKNNAKKHKRRTEKNKELDSLNNSDEPQIINNNRQQTLPTP
jgi:hypothetical protein